jgi:hypothetical protein
MLLPKNQLGAGVLHFVPEKTRPTDAPESPPANSATGSKQHVGVGQGGLWEKKDQPTLPRVRLAMACVVCGYQTTERGALCSIACRKNRRRKLIRPREDDEFGNPDSEPRTLQIEG